MVNRCVWQEILGLMEIFLIHFSFVEVRENIERTENASSLIFSSGPQCQNNLCGSRGSCINTPNGFFRCINCVLGYSGYFCELRKNDFSSE